MATKQKGPGSIPERVAFARKLSGLSQYKLSLVAGLSRAAVGNIEADKEPSRGLDSTTAVALCRVLGLSLDWLILGEGSPPTEASARQAAQTAVRAYEARPAAAPSTPAT